MNRIILNFCRKHSFKIYMTLIILLGISADLELILRLHYNTKMHIIFLVIALLSGLLLLLYGFYEYKHKIGYYKD